MEDRTDFTEIIKAAREGVPIEPRIGHVKSVPYAIVREDEGVQVLESVLRAVEQREPHPNRKQGTSRHFELASFVEHVNRFKEESSAVWADIDSMEVTAVYNEHDKKRAGWRDFQAVYSCRTSPEWQAWLERDGEAMSNEAFANFIEERMEDLTDGEGMPAPIVLLEMARNLQVHTKGQFIRKVNPETGEYTMISKEEHTEGTTKIPRRFALALRVFEGGDAYRVEARISFRVNNGRPMFSYTLHRAEEIKRDAFGHIRDIVAKKTNLTVFAGRP